ncbi:uncharacterized protein LOC112595732 [Melanaphis sacchari]|uniref:uncharacterized protein LOC112595732 n=1 Tax=Melanaphis sacchari TaxID=742174 RepID=UPI000DC152F7|nr:uncharacterized protein LOC112595732 [Melanaphis sacchari]
MTTSIYVSFLFQQSELKANGPLTHQIIIFSEFVNPMYVPYVKLDNVSMVELIKAIRKRLCDNFSVYSFLEGSLINEQNGKLLHAIPTVELYGEKMDKYKFVSSHEGAKRVFLEALNDLDCEYTQLSSDFKIIYDDPPTIWTLTVSTEHDYQELRVIQGYGDSDENQWFMQTSVATTTIRSVRLSEILYTAEHTNIISPKMMRYNDLPVYIDSQRTYEKFRFPRTTKTATKIMRDINREIDKSQVTLYELCCIFLDCLVFILF